MALVALILALGVFFWRSEDLEDNLSVRVVNDTSTNLYGVNWDFDGPDGEVRKLEFAKMYPKTKFVQMSDIDRELIIRWLLGDYRVVFGGEPISTAPKP